MKLPGSFPLLVIAGFLTGSLLAQPAPVAEPAPVAPKPETMAFLRTTPLPDGSRALQTASSEYRRANGSGPGVLLVGVAHLGTKEYYTAIQQRLDRQTVVLYEGIGMHDAQAGPGAVVNKTGLQATLATALGLVFQLDGIDYRRAHFVNSDLHVPDLKEEVEKHTPSEGELRTEETLKNVVNALQGSEVTGRAMHHMIGFLTASPQMQETTKLMLVEVLGRAGEFLTLAKRQSPDLRELFDVLLTQRNEIVMRDLRAQIQRLKAGETVAVFYGTAHMDEIAQRLRDDLGYAPVKEEWATAFTASPAKAGIQPAQLHLMLDLMRNQLQQTPAPTVP